MGSYGDVWLQCEWCWQWGKCLWDEYLDGAEPLWDVDGVGLLCDRCLELEEPPWYPNNRQRCSVYLDHMLFRYIYPDTAVPEVSKLVADHIASNEP